MLGALCKFDRPLRNVVVFSLRLACSFYLYYCSNGQTQFGMDIKEQAYPDLQPETFEDFLRKRAIETVSIGPITKL